MKKFAVVAFFILGLGVSPAVAQDNVVLGGAGTLGKGAGALASAYKQKNSADTVDVIPEAMSTTGGIEGTKTGRLTVGILTRSVTNAEKKEGLVSKFVARIPIIVGVHKSLSVTTLTDAQVCDIFSGKIKSSKRQGASDAKTIVVGRTKDDANMEEFQKRWAVSRLFS